MLSVLKSVENTPQDNGITTYGTLNHPDDRRSHILHATEQIKIEGHELPRLFIPVEIIVIAEDTACFRPKRWKANKTVGRHRVHQWSVK